MSILRITPRGVEPAGDRLGPIVDALNEQRAWLAAVPVARLLTLVDDFARRLPRDPAASRLEGLAMLSAWLGRRNLQQMLELNLNGKLDYLDGFVPHGRNFLAAKPRGLAAMWMAGNVATLPIFSLVSALLAKNVCLVKLAQPEPQGMDRLLAVLAESEGDGLRGDELLRAVAVVWFDYRHRALNEEMSRAADVKIVWGGLEAIEAIARLPRREHCTELIFGPKYSIGVIDRRRLEETGDLDAVAAAFVRDIAAFDQRACSAPQTIFVQRNSRCTLDDVAQALARHLAKLPPKQDADAFTTMRILDARADWAMDEQRGVLASADGANWTVCLDREVSLKEAVQSRTVFLTEIGSWREILPLLSPKIQTAGIAFGRPEDAAAFAEAATAVGVARCVRPGLMNAFESPWDGKLLVGQLVRWVTLKP